MSFHKDFIEGSIWFPKNIGTGVGQFGLVLEILTNDNSYRIMRSDGKIIWATFSIDHNTHEKIL